MTVDQFDSLSESFVSLYLNFSHEVKKTQRNTKSYKYYFQSLLKLARDIQEMD